MGLVVVVVASYSCVFYSAGNYSGGALPVFHSGKKDAPFRASYYYSIQPKVPSTPNPFTNYYQNRLEVPCKAMLSLNPGTPNIQPQNKP